MAEGAIKRMLNECAKDVTFPSTSSVDGAYFQVLTPKSKLVKLALSYARNKTNAYLANPSTSDVILPIAGVLELVQAATLSDGVVSTDVPSITECAAYLTAALEYLYIELLKGCQSQIWNNQFNRAGAVSTCITPDVIDGAINAKFEWPRLFSEQPSEAMDTNMMLRILVIPARGDAMHVVKIDTAQTVAAVCDELKLQVRVSDDLKYCLFLPSDDTEEFHGIFLDPARRLNSYPGVRPDALLEYRPETRSQIIYTSETKCKDFTFAENMTVEQIIKMVINKAGMRDHTRFGLLLVNGDDTSSVSSGNGGSGVGGGFGGNGSTLRSGSSSTVNGFGGNGSTLRSSSSATVNGSSLSLGRTASDDGFSTVNRKMNKARPVSHAFVVGGEGVNRGGKPGSLVQTVDVPAIYRTQRGKGALMGTLTPGTLTDALVVETTDRMDWLNPFQSLRSQSVQDADILLLVRQKKHESFYDQVNENPVRACEKLQENAEQLIKSMLAAIADMTAYNALQKEIAPSLRRELSRPFIRHITNETWVAAQSFIPTGKELDDHLAYRADDKVLVLHKQATRWYGTMANAEGWFNPANGRVPNASGLRGPSKPVFIGVPKEAPAQLQSSSSTSLNKNASGTTLGRSNTLPSNNPVGRPYEGFLMKKGQRFNKWKRQYYRIYSRSLCAYASEKDRPHAPVAAIPITDAEVGPVTSGPHRSPNAFFVRTGGKERIFMTESAELVQAWCLAIRSGKLGAIGILNAKTVKN